MIRWVVLKDNNDNNFKDLLMLPDNLSLARKMDILLILIPLDYDKKSIKNYLEYLEYGKMDG